MEGDTGSNSNGNSKTRCPTKIVSFSINNITGHGYSMQLTIKMMELMKNLLGLKQPEITKTMVAITKLTSDFLNLVYFPLTIDQVILSNLQLQFGWYKKFAMAKQIK